MWSGFDCLLTHIPDMSRCFPSRRRLIFDTLSLLLVWALGVLALGVCSRCSLKVLWNNESDRELDCRISVFFFVGLLQVDELKDLWLMRGRPMVAFGVLIVHGTREMKWNISLFPERLGRRALTKGTWSDISTTSFDQRLAQALSTCKSL